MQLIVPSAARQYHYHWPPNQIIWRPRDRKTICAFVERIGWPTQTSLPWWRWRRCIHHPSARRSLTCPQHLRSKKRSWKTSVQTCGQTFTLVSLDLFVPGISTEVLQRVLSQANKVNVWWPPFRLLAFFAAWRVEAPFSAASCFRWVLHFVLFLTRCVIVHDAASCSREDSLYECERTCEALSCLFFTALWLQSNQSILVQETQSAKDIDLTCFKTFPIKAATCLQVGSMSLDWPVDPFARLDHSRSSISPEVPSDEQQRGALPASTRSRWRQNTLQAPPQVLQHTTGWDGCGRFLSGGLRCITWNTRGLIGSVFPNKRTECWNSNISRSSLTTTTSYVSRRCMERTSISRLFRCWLRDLGFLVLLFLKTKTREDRLSAFTGTFYLKRLLWHIWLLVTAVIVLSTYNLGDRA